MLLPGHPVLVVAKSRGRVSQGRLHCFEMEPGNDTKPFLAVGASDRLRGRFGCRRGAHDA